MATIPLLKRLSLLAAKVETTTGTPIALAAGDATWNAYNISIQPEIEVEEREDPGGFNRRKGAPGARGGTVTFTVDLQWDGTTTPPAWATTFLPSCGWINSTGVFNPSSTAVKDAGPVKALTIGVYSDGRKFFLAGCQGNFEIVCVSGKVIIFNFTFRGVWQVPVDLAILDPTHSTDDLIRWAGGTASYDGTAACVQEATISSGNEIILRECPTETAGYISAVIVDRAPTVSWNPEAELVANDPRHADFILPTEGALAITAGDTFTIAAPKAQIMNVQGGDRDKLLTDDVEFMCNKNGATKDEELTLTFA